MVYLKKEKKMIDPAMTWILGLLVGVGIGYWFCDWFNRLKRL